jgi:hypothetical protein
MAANADSDRSSWEEEKGELNVMCDGVEGARAAADLPTSRRARTPRRRAAQLPAQLSERRRQWKAREQVYAHAGAWRGGRRGGGPAARAACCRAAAALAPAPGTHPNRSARPPPPSTILGSSSQQAIANRECKMLNIYLDDLRDVSGALWGGEGLGAAGPFGGGAGLGAAGNGQTCSGGRSPAFGLTRGLRSVAQTQRRSGRQQLGARA